MFVDFVSSEYDLDSLEDFAGTAVSWNGHSVTRSGEDFSFREMIKPLPNQHAKSLGGREVKPMMSSCSGRYKQNPDGSWEFEGKIDFATTKENQTETSAGKGTTSNENDPPDSRDRAEG